MAPDAISHWCDTTYLALGHFDRHGIWMRARAGAVHKHRGDRGLKEQQPCPHPWEASSNKRRNLISSSSFILTTSAAYRYSQGGDNISIRLSEGLLKRKGGGGGGKSLGCCCPGLCSINYESLPEQIRDTRHRMLASVPRALCWSCICTKKN